MLDTALSLLMLVSLALIGGAMILWRKGERKRPALMLVLAAVMALNLVIWTLPTTQGGTLVAEAQK
ncbi:hypothetical protein OLX02_06560 [Novosphingobium sp. KCTC 2891]|uniref:hypothetical protein n=1 Tax=Novosphingobium sp. KCTC 2891 TaxID=2989730 RepID=UPI002222093C|nr:hypothetical protein [Novosphingobium sp. KCTC 2891]MCW1382479.1 hypothetical protein [Novosphingobium sp. KCTC 2891]